MDWISLISNVLLFITGGGIAMLLTAGTQRRKAKLDLIKELNDELADKTRKIRELQAEVLQLTTERHDFEMRHISTRCDLQNCRYRRPPLPWMPAEMDTQSAALPASMIITQENDQ